jgi:haloacetate dehalogenase
MTGSAFAGLEEDRIATPRGPVLARAGGAGPPLLLLHGYLETHLTWAVIALFGPHCHPMHLHC